VAPSTAQSCGRTRSYAGSEASASSMAGSEARVCHERRCARRARSSTAPTGRSASDGPQSRNSHPPNGQRPGTGGRPTRQRVPSRAGRGPSAARAEVARGLAQVDAARAGESDRPVRHHNVVADHGQAPSSECRHQGALACRTRAEHAPCPGVDDGCAGVERLPSRPAADDRRHRSEVGVRQLVGGDGRPVEGGRALFTINRQVPTIGQGEDSAVGVKQCRRRRCCRGLGEVDGSAGIVTAGGQLDDRTEPGYAQPVSEMLSGPVIHTHSRTSRLCVITECEMGRLGSSGPPRVVSAHGRAITARLRRC